jgi:Protein of unknown function (DUF3089)
MRVFLYAVGAIVALIILIAVVGAGFYFTGNVGVLLGVFGPRNVWDADAKAPAPDYADVRSWAALPTNPGLTAYVPAGVEAAAKDPQVDVFFIHPTGDMSGAGWNSSLDPNSQTEENTRWMMANQAAAFNGCCAIYAPRYREASIFRYVSATPELYKQAGDFAYADVDRAFTYFLEHYSKGRPFIIATHSQGTEHGFNLIRRRIDGTPLAQRMVAAYLLGGSITDKEADGLKTVHVCSSPTDTHCFVHWATYGEGPLPVRNDVKGKIVCVNPLTWQRDGAMAPASLNIGSVPISGRFEIKFWGNDEAQGMKFPPVKAPLKAWTSAECRAGFLFAQDQKGGPFAFAAVGHNYHGLDYALFAMNIRENAKARVAAYLSQTVLK